MNNKAKEAYEKYIKDKISPDISSITDIKDLEDFIIEFNKVPDIFKKIIIQKQKIFLDDCMALRDVAIKYAVYFTYSQYMQFISDFRGTAQEIYDNAIKNGINIEDYGMGNTVEDIQKKIDFDKDMRLAIIDYVLNYFDSIGKKKEFVNELEGFICRSEECFNKFNRVNTTIQLFKKEIKMSQNETNYVYAISREDLPLSYRFVQAAHALLEASRQHVVPPNIIHPHFVFCQTKNENKLKDIISLLNENDIKFSTWNEPDLQNELTAISTEPISGEKRQLLRKLSLIKG